MNARIADSPLSQTSVLIDQVDQAIHNVPVLENTGTGIKSTLHRWIISDQKRRVVADLLHGTWLGHPLHPVLTDATIGAWLFGAVFDVLSLINFRSKTTRKMADRLTTIGTITAVPTALTGMTDYSGIKKDAVAHGTLHGILNSIGLTLYVLSLRTRRKNRLLGVMFSLSGFTLLTFSAWIGGELVYRFRVGVNHAQEPSQPETWMPVLPDAELVEGQPERIDVEGNPVLLYRKNGTVYAIGAVCSHAGGPLEQGKFEGVCVQCPWHDSVYDLRDGSVVHGPSTYRQPTYEARTFNGQIEVRVVNQYQHSGA
jgi:nitrite reductase/ring-hydroxylating ferredoxin subunit/uncharacterized membrane protein